MKKRNIFQHVARTKVPRTTFDLSHERKLSCDMGQLVPILCEEVVPGDKFNINTESMVRFAPMTAPIMHRVDIYMHYFFVPNRIIWDDWEKFITGDLETVVPTIAIGESSSVPEGSILDFMGIPTGNFVGSGETINALPFRAYLDIYNNYYRDENLSAEKDILQPELYVNQPPLKRAWEKDYFTSALPWAQKGGEVVLNPEINYSDDATVYRNDGADPSNGIAIAPAVGQGYGTLTDDTVNQGSDLKVENLESIGININDLRTATRLQRWLEKNARAGSRYVEHLLAHWGVISDDARLDRPEYIGGGKSPVVISEVLNTAGVNAEEGLPQGTMAGHGISVGAQNRASKYCKEHGWIMGIMSIMPRTNYYQGIHKKFSRSTPFDYYFPEFAHLGEQEVKNKEIFMSSGQEDNDKTFGYQSRFAEMKYAQSTVHNTFRTSLDFWHLARKFASRPQLNETFILADPRTDIFAVEEANKDHLWVQLFHNITARRPMPYYNDPRL